jgi:hypothetical protein
MNQQPSTALAELPGFPMAATKPTLTRQTELIFNPKSESEYGEDEEDEEEEKEAEPEESDRSVASARETAPESSNSDSQQRQYTPAHVRDSKGPKKLDSRHSFRNKMRDPETTAETKFVP